MAKGKVTKASKLKSLNLMDGKAAPTDTIDDIRTIDEILGTKPQGPFKAKTLAEFEKQLDTEMNLADMQALAPRVGLIPVADRTLLRKRLVDEFKKNLARVRGVPAEEIMRDISPREDLYEKAARILKQGS